MVLKALHRAGAGNKKKKLLKRCLKDKDFISCISECFKNVVKGHVRLSPGQRRALLRKAKHLRLLASRKTSLASKKKAIQSGGFLGAILGPIVKVLGGLFSG